jgi:hypothetical protein
MKNGYPKCKDGRGRTLELIKADNEHCKLIEVWVEDEDDIGICEISEGQAENLIRFLNHHFQLDLLKS